MNEFIKIAKAVMVGHAVGDALGVPVEFRTRDYLNKNPVTEMIGFGTHPVPKGAWSDDTSMSLCALESLSKGKIDFDDVMLNFGKWYYYNEYTATGETFDIGNTCSEAIHRYFKEKIPYNKCGLSDEYSNGNGSLMRIHPFTLYLIHKNKRKMDDSHYKIIGQASALTHAHVRSQIACFLYSYILWEIIESQRKECIKNTWRDIRLFFSHRSADCGGDARALSELGYFSRIFDGIDKLNVTEIMSDGYVVHTLEAAIWCLLTTDSYEECVLKAVNLGDDTDTTAAVAGGLAGALYGYDAIPEEWRNSLLRRDYIEELCEKAFK